MEVIDLKHSVDNDDVSRLLDRIGERPLSIINHIYSSLSFSYNEGVVKLDGKGSGVDVWMPLFESPNVTAAYTTNLGTRHILKLPTNVSTLYVDDIGDVERIKSWISGKTRNLEQRGMTVRYVGSHARDISRISVVNPSITHLQLPFGEELESIVDTNPHLQSVGVDLDKRKHKHDTLPVVMWSVNGNRLRHSSGDNIIESILY